MLLFCNKTVSKQESNATVFTHNVAIIYIAMALWIVMVMTMFNFMLMVLIMATVIFTANLAGASSWPCEHKTIQLHLNLFGSDAEDPVQTHYIVRKKYRAKYFFFISKATYIFKSAFQVTTKLMLVSMFLT